MPLLVGGTNYFEAAESATGSELWYIKSQGPGSIGATWIDPDGLLYPLTHIWDQGPGYFTMDGPSAWGAAPIELVTDPYPRGGEKVRYIRTNPRRIQWPLYVGGDSHLEFVANYRTIMKAFTKTTARRATGILEITRPDNSKRRINAFYEQGFEGEAGENWLWAKPTIQLFCPDAYFFDATPKVWSSAITPDPDSGTTRNFFTPFITIDKEGSLADDTEVSVPPINNPGDVDAYPTWTIVGPMNGLEATNVTSGLRFKLEYMIPAGVTVTITTDPATVRDSTGLTLSKYIDWFNTAGTALWAFAPGDNTVSFTAASPGAGSSVAVSFNPRYEAA